MILDYWGKPLKTTSTPSAYRPDDTTKDRTSEVLKDFKLALSLRQKTYPEFNDRTLIDYQSDSQRAFNGYKGPSSNDPDESWKANVVRPITRNRIISIAAHVTGAVIYPSIFAQNTQDEEDKDASTVMRDLMEWSGENSTPTYVRTFLYAVVAALVNPAVIIRTEFAEVYRKIKEIRDTGWTEKRVIDEVMSGFQDAIVPVDELYIADFYTHDIQKQGFLIRRRVLDYNVAKAKHGDHADWEHVKAGVQTLFDKESEGWYDQKDSKLSEHQVEEVIYERRHDDLCLYYVNGVLVSDPDQPNPREDKKYPYAKTGYELVDEGQFFYYRSLADKMSSDQEVIDRLYELTINGAILDMMPPLAHYGNEEIDKSVIVPGAVNSFSETTKLERINTGGNSNAAQAMLEKVEASASESSQDILQSGQSVGGDQTAYEIGRLEANAKIMLGMFAKMIGFLVQEYGYLRVGDILQYMTIADIGQGSGAQSLLRFQSFLMPDRQVEGKTKTRKIEFTYDRAEDDMDESNKILEREDKDGAPQIYKVNPDVFRQLKFKIRVIPEPKPAFSDALDKALRLEAYDRAVSNPLANQEAIFKDFLLGGYDFAKGDTGKYIKEQPDPMQAGAGADPSQQLLGQITNTKPQLGKLIGA